MAGVDSVGANYYNAHTKNGNPYNKTKTCRKVGFWTPVAIIGGTSIVTGGVLTKCMATKGVKDATKTFFTTSGLLLLKNAGKMLKYGILGFITGLVIDKIINHQRRKNADKPVYLK